MGVDNFIKCDLTNNLGEAMQRNGMMTEFTTEVEFTHIFEGL